MDISAGANVRGTEDRRGTGTRENVVTILCDTGERYISIEKYFQYIRTLIKMEFTDEQINRYSRHILLPRGRGRGRKIAKCAFRLVGAGGLGSPAAYSDLAAAGVGTIGLIDSDVVDLTNLQRQVLHYTPDVGRPKVLSGKEKIQALNPDVSVSMYEERLTAGNAIKIFTDYDVVIPTA